MTGEQLHREVAEDVVLFGQGVVILAYTSDGVAATERHLRIDPLCFVVVDGLPTTQHQPGCRCTPWGPR